MEYSKELHEQTKGVLEEKLWFHNTDVIRKLLENYPLFLSEIDRLTKLLEWIPVSPETMPEDYEIVQVFDTLNPDYPMVAYHVSSVPEWKINYGEMYLHGKEYARIKLWKRLSPPSPQEQP